MHNTFTCLNTQSLYNIRPKLCLCLLRDADETKEWIEEKNQALNTDNYGHDLASVQALQRKHEGFERDLAALGDKVRFISNEIRLFFSPLFLGHLLIFPAPLPR